VRRFKRQLRSREYCIESGGRIRGVRRGESTEKGVV